MNSDPTFVPILGGVMIGYVVLMYVIAIVAARRITTVEDFVVAGRQLPFSLSWMTILATWFGAGTLLAVADEVRLEGVRAAALDPIGAGCCLLFVGLFVAAPMWREKLLTVPDFFGRRFGRRAELVSALILVPSYFGWIAAQFVAIANLLQLFFGIEFTVGLTIAAVVGSGYTLMGGMWSVTLTDAVQISLVLIGLVILLLHTLAAVGSGSVVDGWHRILRETDTAALTIVPHDTLRDFTTWMGVFVTGALGNVPVQDLMQRVFASRSARTARWACLTAGVAYITFGAIPVVLALASKLLFPTAEAQQSILPLLAQTFLHPWLASVFIVCLLSAVMSTIDSAILSPATVLAQNVFGQQWSDDPLARNRVAILMVTVCSLFVAFRGESAYGLLEQAYALTLVGLFVPLMMGLYRRRHVPAAGIGSMLAGTSVWGLHLLMGWETFLPRLRTLSGWQLPVSLSATFVSLLAYLLIEATCRGADDQRTAEVPD